MMPWSSDATPEITIVPVRLAPAVGLVIVMTGGTVSSALAFARAIWLWSVRCP
jgi:hypothetical protein